jgi:hypothetical protein
MAMQAHLLRGDALFAMGEFCVAEDAYADALNPDPSIHRSKSFKVSIREHCNFMYYSCSYLILRRLNSSHVTSYSLVQARVERLREKLVSVSSSL